MSSAVPLRAKIGREEIKWQELLSHFRAVQSKHEKSRRQAVGADLLSFGGSFANVIRSTEPGSRSGLGIGLADINRPPMRRRVTGEVAPPVTVRPVLSPLNPRAKQNGLLGPSMAQSGQPTMSSASALGGALAMQQRQRRTLGLGPRK